MKHLILALLCLSSASAFGSGKIIAQGTSYFLSGSHKIGPSVGLSVVEKLGMERVALNSWVGVGKVERELEDATWFTTSHFVEMYLSRLTVGLGYKLSSDLSWDRIDHGVAAKLAFKLWD